MAADETRPSERPAAAFDIDANRFSFEGHMRYDLDEGELHVDDGVIHRIVKIRQRLEDDLTLQAIIVELERRGYTVISPE